MLKILHAISILIVLLGIVSCRKEKYVDQRISDNYYYSVDSTQILYDSAFKLINARTPDYKKVPADVESFRPIGPHFGKDTLHVFYADIILKNVNWQSFYWDDVNKMPKDKYHVYLPTTSTSKLTVVKYADPETYEKVNLEYDDLRWYKDKSHYFYDNKLTSANRASLNFTNPLLPYDNSHVFYLKDGGIESEKYRGAINILNKYVLRDNKRFFIAYFDDATLVAYKDSSSFHALDDKLFYLSIDSCIYYQGEKMSADYLSFIVVGQEYSKDQNTVYYGSLAIVGSDPKTFRLLNEEYAKDKRQVYKYGDILSRYRSITFISDKWGRYPPDANYGKEPVNKKTK